MMLSKLTVHHPEIIVGIGNIFTVTKLCVKLKGFIKIFTRLGIITELRITVSLLFPHICQSQLAYRILGKNFKSVCFDVIYAIKPICHRRNIIVLEKI